MNIWRTSALSTRDEGSSDRRLPLDPRYRRGRIRGGGIIVDIVEVGADAVSAVTDRSNIDGGRGAAALVVPAAHASEATARASGFDLDEVALEDTARSDRDRLQLLVENGD